jgi:hypothetical protein
MVRAHPRVGGSLPRGVGHQRLTPSGGEYPFANEMRMHIGEDRAARLSVAHVVLISLTRETP